MKILQQGVLPRMYKKFVCENCGCVFEADKSEYFASGQMEVLHDGLPNYKCECPTCKNMVYSN